MFPIPTGEELTPAETAAVLRAEADALEEEDNAVRGNLRWCC